VVSALALAPAGQGAELLAFESVSKARPDATALHEVSLAVPRRARVALVGPCGAGKSLLLRLALGLERPDAGRVRLFDRDPGTLGAREQDRLRTRLGMLWPSGALFDDLDVAGNVGFVLREIQARPRAEVERAVRESLLLVGLKHVEHLRVDELPRGVRRRVALARAVAHRPELLLLDEPSAGLDPVAAAALRELIVQLHERLALSVLVATHDPAWAFAIADRVVMLHAGRVLAAGPPDAVRATPDAAVQQLLAGRAHGPIEP
jgi:phospholipid/cholesterol/gamma-HCH transport system ATP-binding protein